MATARQLYEAVLIEMNKVEAPSMLLEDFNYFANKAIMQYINKRYNLYDVNQQTSDDIRVLKSTAVLKPINEDTNIYGENKDRLPYTDSLYGAIVEFELPLDYLHILNCICNFKVADKGFKCYKGGSNVQFAARRLTSDMWSQVINNFYMKPSYRRPYFFIHNVNTLETDEDNKPVLPSDDFLNLPTQITIGGNNISFIDREAPYRYGNSEPVRLEIRYGKDQSIFKLDKIYIDYIKTPQHIQLTQEQIDLTEDTSQVLEFPDYVCHEIINELVKLIMENASDPRLQTNMPINQTIASPVPQGK